MSYKILRLIILLLIVGSPSLFSALPKETGNNDVEKFVIKSRQLELEDGRVLPSKSFVIEKKSDRYLPNVFIIKTKSNYGKLDGSVTFPDGMIQSYIQDLGIKNIVSPLANTSKTNLSNLESVVNIHEVYYDAPVDPFDVCKVLMSNPQVEYATPVYKRELHYRPNDPMLSEQYAIEEMNLEKAWSVTKSNEGITIAIVDSGTEIGHADLAENIWTNPGEVPNDGKDNDGNGKIDDVHGWDLVGNTSSSQMSAGQWQEDSNPTPPSGGNDHGTHVAGCAAAVTNNSVGVAAPGFNASIIPIKCGLDNGQSGIFRGYTGIAYAADLGADIINCSWGGMGGSAYEQDVINLATSKGSLVVTSSGNESLYSDLNPTYPSNYDNVLNVGATKEGKRYASFSNYGREVHVYAPGDQILATQLGGGYSRKTGTSMASPIVAGVAALVKALHPNWTPKQIIHQIRGTSANVIYPQQQSMFFGLVDAEKAVTVNPTLNDGPNSMPGLEITEVKDANDLDFVFTQNGKATIKLNIHNYLAKSSNTKVELIPLENYLEVEQANYTVPDIKLQDDHEITAELTLTKLNPWFTGFVQLLVKFEADNYINYQLLKLNIDIESVNIFSAVARTPLTSQVTWHDMSCGDTQSFWMGGSLYGSQGYFMSGSNNSGWRYDNMPVPIYAVEAVSNSTVYMGGTSYNGLVRVYKTTTMGQEWEEQNLTPTTSFINGIHFWTEEDGIVLGDPQDGNWGIATTLDGGETWTDRSAPAPLTNETGLVHNTFVTGDNCYFGTTAGRVYRSNNKGRKWLVSNVHSGGVVNFVAFSDEDRGIAIYKEKPDATELYIANTTNGGSSWKTKVNNLTEEGYNPINVFKPDGSNHILIICENGEILFTEDLGATLGTYLNGRFYQNDLAALSSHESNARLWTAGEYITSTDFRYKPANAVRALALQDEEISFGDIDTGSTKTRFVRLTSTGNYRVELDNVLFEVTEGEDDEFTLETQAPQVLEVDESFAFRVEFAPKTVGTKSAKLTINSNAETPVIEVILTGNGTEVFIASKQIDVASSFEFGTVDLGSDSTAVLSVENTGNSKLTITSMKLVGSDSDNFSINADILPLDIEAGETEAINPTFAPLSEGDKTAILNIVSNADNGAQKVTLTGLGHDPSSVFESPYGTLELTNYPNPAIGMTNIEFVLPTSSFVQLNLYDMNGTFVGTLYRNNATAGKNSVSFTTENIPSGTYMLEMQYNGKQYIHKFSVAK